MLSKYKSDCQKIDSDSLIKKFYTDSYSLKGVDYDSSAYEPKKDLYSTYFNQNRKNFLIKSHYYFRVIFRHRLWVWSFHVSLAVDGHYGNDESDG
jgi:hypothetical protein